MRTGTRWLVALSVTAGLVGLGAVSAEAATSPAHRSTCTGTVKITSFAFVPATVARGQSSTATLKARNCTGTVQQTTTYWYGHFSGPGTGIPAGCPVIDPLPRPLAFTAHGTGSLQTTYRVFPTCTATSLTITVRVVGSGGTVLASRNATLAITT